MALVGIDVGTSGCKVVAFGEKGKVLSQASREYPFLVPRPGWLEIDPEQIRIAVNQSLGQVLAQTKEPIQSMAVASHGETLLPLDREGRFLHPAIANFDTRAYGYVDFWREKIDPFELFQISGMPLHGMYTVNKVLWLRDNLPQIWKRVWKLVCMEDYLLYYLTGEEPKIDPSLAARTMLLDTKTQKWSNHLFELADLEPDLFSSVVPSGEAVGQLRPSLAREFGISYQPIVATGGHDQPCGVLGCGIKQAGEAMYGMGTSHCVALNLGNQPRLTREMMANAFCCSPHVIADSYITLAYIASGGSVLRWFRDEFGFEEKLKAEAEKKDPYQLLMERMPSTPASVFLLPHFAGSGTPYLDERSLGAIVGLNLGTTKGELIRAILESLTYEMKYNLELIESFGVAINSLRAVGGGSRSERWLSLAANILQKPISTFSTGEAVAKGAAMLAGWAKGEFASWDEAIQRMVAVAKTIEPEEGMADHYQPRYEIYRKIYRQLRELNQEISSLF